MAVQQGDLLKVSGITYPVIVVSNDFFNQSGKVIACPIVQNAVEGPLHIPLKDVPIQGLVLCEQLRYLDLTARGFSKLSSTHYYDMMDLSDAVMSIFDYRQM